MADPGPKRAPTSSSRAAASRASACPVRRRRWPRAGYTFPRVAGTSAGAVVGAFLVALQRAGEPIERLEDVARTLDYKRLRDRGVRRPGRRPAGPAGRRVLAGLRRRGLRGRLPAVLGQGRAGRPRRADVRRPAGRRPGQQPARGPALLAGGHGQRRLAQAARPAALGLPALRPRPRRAGGRRRRARLGVDPVLLRAGHPAVDGRRGGQHACRPWSTAACCRTSRSRCSTAPTGGRRAGRPSASGCRCGRTAGSAPPRSAAPCPWRCPSSRRCSRPATRSTSTTRACRRAASSSTRRASRRSTSASPTSSRSSCCWPATRPPATSWPAGTGRRTCATCRGVRGRAA